MSVELSKAKALNSDRFPGGGGGCQRDDSQRVIFCKPAKETHPISPLPPHPPKKISRETEKLWGKLHQVPRRFPLGPHSLTLAGDGGLGGTVVSGAPGAQEVVGARWRWRWRCGWPGQHLPRGCIPAAAAAAAHGDPEDHVRAEARWPATGTGTRGARGLRGPLVRVRLGHLAVHGAGPGRAGLLGRRGTAGGQLERSDPLEFQARVRADHLSPGVPHPVPTYPITPSFGAA